MATVLRVRRLSSNPRRRRMTARQIRFFGTRRQKAALRSNRRRRNLDAFVGPGGVIHPIRGTSGYSARRAHERVIRRAPRRKAKRRRNLDAFVDARGIVHPIRGTSGYSRRVVGERPARKRKARRTAGRKRARRRNTGLVVTLGPASGLAANPRRRGRRNMARRYRRRSVRRDNRRRRARRSNRRRYYVRHRRMNRRRDNRGRYRRRRSNRRYSTRHRRYRNRRYARRRRNPGIMGHPLGSKTALKLIGGGLLGVAAVKFIPRFLPTGLIPGGGSPFMTVIVTGASAILAGWLIGKIDPDLGHGATFGGLMVAGSQAINAIAPGLAIAGVPIGGLGDLMPGAFSVPQNPLRLPPPPQPAGGGGARVTVSGLGRAYGPAF